MRYDTEHLCLLAAYNNDTGVEQDLRELQHYATLLRCKLVERHDHLQDMKDVLRAAQLLAGSAAEGFVVLLENGERRKIKSPQYVCVACRLVT